MKLQSRAIGWVFTAMAGFAASCSGSEFTASTGGAGDAGASGASSNAGGSAQAGEAGVAETAGAAGVETAGAAGEDNASGDAGMGGITAQGGTGGGMGGASGGHGGTSSGGHGGASSGGDDDQDGFGRSSGEVKACSAPTSGKWARNGGDCNDDNPTVFPMNPQYYSDGYTTAGNALSFDYDCSGQEEEDPGARGAAPTCSSLSCSGSGFRDTGRTGTGINALCGSKTLVTCSGSLLKCSAVESDVSDGAPCH